MTINARSFLFVLLFLHFANILSGQENNGVLKHRIAWTRDEYALRYEAVIEREENNNYSLVLREFTEEPFIYFSLPPGNYRLRVITYDFRDIPGEGTKWKNFVILAAADTDSEPQLVMDNEEDTVATEDQTDAPDSTPPELTAQEAEESADSEEPDFPSAENRDLFIALLAEGSGYTRHSVAFGGGVVLGGSLNGKGIGISLLYAQDAEKFMFLEAIAHFRYYLSFLSRAEINTGLFLQAEGGVVLFSYEKFEMSGHLNPVAGISAGWRFPLGTRWYIEPAIRGGYPYIIGASVSAGMRFDW